jgi:diaminopimelate decarboxylase
VYDAESVRRRIDELGGFDVVRYAQKANSCRALLEIVRTCGAQVDAVSAGEVLRALAAGFDSSEIVYTSDVFDRAALSVLALHPVPVNIGSPNMLDQYAQLLDAAWTVRGERGRDVMLRLNPGFGHGHGKKVTTGGETSKHGIWHEDLPSVAQRAVELGLRVTGLHVHIGSGSDLDHLTRACAAMQGFARTVGDSLTTISNGGGLPIPYRDGEPRIDVARFTEAWVDTKHAIERELGITLKMEVEPGRYLVAEAGALLCEVRGVKRSGRYEYVLVDAGFHNLVRPAMYGAYHQISVVGRTGKEPTAPKVVAGPLCESADVFTVNANGELAPIELPALREGDLLCIHDAGAYAASMASNYNSQPFAAEVLVDGGTARLVRRRQSFDSLMADEPPAPPRA